MPTLPATTVDFFLAGLEAFMVRSGQGMHWGVTQLWLAGRPDAAALQSAWEQMHAQQPLLGARLRRQWRGWRLAWETSGPIPAPPIIWHPPQPLPPDDGVLQERLQGRTPAGGLTSPLLLEVFPWGDGGAHRVLLTWRHALMDGTGVNLLLTRLAGGGGGDAGPPPVVVPPREGLGRLFKKARPLLRRMHTMTLDGCLSAWSKGAPQAGAPAFRLIELTLEQSHAAVMRLRETCGDFMQMPFYAAIAARALRRLHERRGWHSPVLHLHLPCQVRGRSREHLFGNHMGALPLFLDAGALGTPDQAIKHVLEQYREALKQGMAQASEALMALSTHLPVTWFMPVVRWTNRGQICSLFHSHTGTFLAGCTTFAGAAVQNVVTIPSVSTPPGLGIFFSDFAGRITVTLAWREGGVTAAEEKLLCGQILTDLTGASAA